MEDKFFDLLASRIIDNDFTEKRFRDAINYVLDNYDYPELKISQIIKFDKRAKLYTYEEACALIPKGYLLSDFEKREINGVVYRVKKVDLLNM